MILTLRAVLFACGQVTGDLRRGRKRPFVVAWAQGLAVVISVGLIFTLLPIVVTAMVAAIRSLWRPSSDPDGTAPRIPTKPGKLAPML